MTRIRYISDENWPEVLSVGDVHTMREELLHALEYHGFQEETLWEFRGRFVQDDQLLSEEQMDEFINGMALLLDGLGYDRKATESFACLSNIATAANGLYEALNHECGVKNPSTSSGVISFEGAAALRKAEKTLSARLQDIESIGEQRAISAVCAVKEVFQKEISKERGGPQHTAFGR